MRWWRSATSTSRACSRQPRLPTTATTKVADYRRILDNREIDAVLIGTPDHWHKTIALDAVAAGKDVYVEKPMSHTIEEGVEMVKADRSLEADRADRHPAAKLGSLGAGQANHRLRPSRADYVRPDLLVSARDRRQLSGRFDGQARLEDVARLGSRSNRSGRNASISGVISGITAADK